MRIHRAVTLGVVCLALAACGPDGAEPAPVSTSTTPAAAEGSPTTTCVPPPPAAPPSISGAEPMTTAAPADPPVGAVHEGMSAADAAAAARASADRAAELAAETQKLADETMEIHRQKLAEEAARQNGQTLPC